MLLEEVARVQFEREGHKIGVGHGGRGEECVAFQNELRPGQS